MPQLADILRISQRMARFYFHLQIGSRLVRDARGIDMPSSQHAREQALLSMRELVADAVKAGTDLELEAVVVANTNGRELMLINVREVLPQRLRAVGCL